MTDDDAEARIAEMRRQAEAQRAEYERIIGEQEAAFRKQVEEAQQRLDAELAAGLAAAEAQVAEARANLEQKSAEARARRLEVLRRRRVDDPEATLARIEKEAQAEAERARPLIEQRVAEELRRIRAALDLRLRPLLALPPTPEREQEIADARTQARAQEHVAEIRGKVELANRAHELLEAKLRIG